LEDNLMQHFLSRRSWMQIVPLGFATPLAVSGATSEPRTVSSLFPTQDPDLVREMVSVSHGKIARVRELVKARPALARAAWDWGFGDWETALGAASHTGNTEIASLLIENGAPPTLFSATMLGHLDVVKALIAAQPGVQRIPGPHSISLLAHARNGGVAAEPVLRYLESLGDAGSPTAAPITPEEAAALAGAYSFGAGPTDRIEISAAGNQLTFTRKGTTGRGLVHVGDRAFHPAGAFAVRIRFTGTGADTLLTVHDPDPVLTARRVPPVL
jgi:hypothetical protein